MGDIERKINTLIGSLEGQLQDTSGRVEKLELLSKKLIPENELSNFLKEYKDFKQGGEEGGVRKEDQAEEDPEASMIKELEQQRINLVMDIQEQDYIRDKLLELINHNSDMVSSVKEYLENKPQMIKDDYAMINERLKHYIHDFVRPSVDGLKLNNMEMNKQLSNVESLLTEVSIKLEYNELVISSPEYRAKLNECIKILNELFKKMEMN